MRTPYVIVNCAMSSDGKTASPTGRQIRISCDEDIERMYNLRNKCDAVLVGVNTVISDNPRLTVKETYVKKPVQPVRVILDTHLRTPMDALTVDNSAKTLIITGEKFSKKYGDNVELVQCSLDKDGFIDLKNLLDLLCKRGIKKLMVEGGSTVIWSFLNHDLVDETFVYVSPMIIGGKNTPYLAKDIKDFEKKSGLKLVDEKRLGPGRLFCFKRKK